jgi:hypothetical protein
MAAIAEADRILAENHPAFQNGDLIKVVHAHTLNGHAARLAAYATIGTAAALLDSRQRHELAIVAKRIADDV